MPRQNISSGTPWEASVGYSRAVRVGNSVHVSGTVASDENGQVIGAGDAYAQGVYTFQKIERALTEAGSSLADVVSVRMFVTDIADWEDVARAFTESVGEFRPTSTLVAVSALIDPAFVVEIEVEALLEN